MNIQILSRIPVLHRADASGVVVVERQLIEIDGRRFEAKLWANWANPTVITRVDSNPVEG